MILNDSLYKIKSYDSETRSFEIELLRDNVIYRSHFPEKPITPGVCIIQIATELLGKMLGGDMELQHVTNAKFLSIINPLETQEVIYTFNKISEDAATGEMKVNAIVSGKEIIFSKLSLHCRKR